jgi:hypothetical protein
MPSMRLPWEEIEPLINAAVALKGLQVHFRSSLTTRRGLGGVPHDRHGATALTFTLEVQSVGVAISGDRLMFVGSGAHFEIGLRNLTSFSLEQEGSIEIVEQFEQHTERLTQLTVKRVEPLP